MRLMVIVALLVPVASLASELLADYAKMRVGSFTSAAQAARDARYDLATRHIGEIWTDDDAKQRWFYSESWLEGAASPYMQRVSRVQELGNGVLQSTPYRLENSADFEGGWQDGKSVPARKQTKLLELVGCVAHIVRAGQNRFESSTTANNCRNAYKGASYVISRSVMSDVITTNWDRGFSADGELVWGPEHSGYQFRRVGDDACVKPVRMLVYGSIKDRSKFGAYGQALGESGLYPKNGGYYEAISPPLAVFEGEPGESRGVIIARFPCLQAAKDFWYSDEYQAIRPLREGIAEFEVIVLGEPALPKYLDW